MHGVKFKFRHPQSPEGSFPVASVVFRLPRCASWTICTVNTDPARWGFNRRKARRKARHSCLNVSYAWSVLFRNINEYGTGVAGSFAFFWNRMHLTCLLSASVSNGYHLVVLGKASRRSDKYSDSSVYRACTSILSRPLHWKGWSLK